MFQSSSRFRTRRPMMRIQPRSRISFSPSYSVTARHCCTPSIVTQSSRSHGLFARRTMIRVRRTSRLPLHHLLVAFVQYSRDSVIITWEANSTTASPRDSFGSTTEFIVASSTRRTWDSQGFGFECLQPWPNHALLFRTTSTTVRSTNPETGLSIAVAILAFRGLVR